MDDLISRKAVFELLDDIDSIYLEDYDDTFKSYMDLVNALFDEDRLPSAQPDMSEYSDKLWKAAYERGKAEAQQRWIPCSERLPEERQEILATTTDNAWGDVVIIRTYYKEMHKSVIAWMPLPEPYRAERRTDG